jgi:tripartite ATP-independent transporter DctP family solute receptor
MHRQTKEHTRSRRAGAAALTLAATVVVALAGCGGTSDSSATSGSGGGGKKYVMKIASTTFPGDFIQGGADAFKAAIEKSPVADRLSVQLICCGKLGSATDMWDSLRLGAVQGYVAPSQAAEPRVAQLGLFDLPYLFTSFAARNKAIDDPAISKVFDDKLEADGVTPIGWFGGGERNVYGNGKPINSPADLKGQKIRVLTSEAFTDTFKAYGAVPVDLPISDVYLGLSQGTINLAETAFTSAIAAKQDEVSKNFALTKHTFGLTIFGVNKKWLDGLPADLQAAVKKAADQATASERQAEANSEAQIEQKLKAAGKTMTTPDLAPFRATASKIWTQLMQKAPTTYDKTIINQVRASEGQPPLS